jgi:hypothetical protein
MLASRIHCFLVLQANNGKAKMINYHKSVMSFLNKSSVEIQTIDLSVPSLLPTNSSIGPLVCCEININIRSNLLKL